MVIALIGMVTSIVTSLLVLAGIIITAQRAGRAEVNAKAAADTTTETANRVDGKMDMLLKATAGQSHAEGMLAGAQEQRVRSAEPQS